MLFDFFFRFVSHLNFKITDFQCILRLLDHTVYHSQTVKFFLWSLLISLCLFSFFFLLNVTCPALLTPLRCSPLHLENLPLVSVHYWDTWALPATAPYSHPRLLECRGVKNYCSAGISLSTTSSPNQWTRFKLHLTDESPFTSDSVLYPTTM